MQFAATKFSLVLRSGLICFKQSVVDLNFIVVFLNHITQPALVYNENIHITVTLYNKQLYLV